MIAHLFIYLFIYINIFIYIIFIYLFIYVQNNKRYFFVLKYIMDKIIIKVHYIF